MTSHRDKWRPFTVGTLAKVAAVVVCSAAAAVAAGFMVVQTGCSDCASDCPPATVYIGNLSGQQLAIDDILVDGPACPPQHGVYCIGDGPTTNCTHVTITGVAEGFCDVYITFRDRPNMVVRTEFGPPIKHGCCKGHTIVGDSVFVVPASSDAGISGLDGGTDAVTIVVDAGSGDASD
jgi:hypothetical protein